MINGETKVYGIIGNPVGHSLSPLMHNAAFREKKLNCVYVPFPVSDVSQVVNAVRCLKIQGLSVTAPFKESIIPLLDECDESSRKIGAVNTVKFNGVKVLGINTDWIGAVRAIERKISLKDKKCVVIGAGGAARALVFGLKKWGVSLIVVNRNVSRGEKIAREFFTDFAPLDRIEELSCDVLINATPVGMFPREGETLVPKSWLKGSMLVMDMVYRPRMTKLIRNALEKGCEVVEGLEMLLEQGIAQFEWWTGEKAPRESMARAIGLT